jgi:hypothetical protein
MEVAPEATEPTKPTRAKTNTAPPQSLSPSTVFKTKATKANTAATGAPPPQMGKLSIGEGKEPKPKGKEVEHVQTTKPTPANRPRRRVKMGSKGTRRLKDLQTAREKAEKEKQEAKKKAAAKKLKAKKKATAECK